MIEVGAGSVIVGGNGDVVPPFGHEPIGIDGPSEGEIGENIDATEADASVD